MILDWFRSVVMAFSMFSVLPTPRIAWKKENMRYMLCALPLVGVLIGAAALGWFYLAQALELGTVLYAAGLTLLPLGLSGGIHLDGFCDTADARASCAEPARRREILKDSHTGAFALIHLCVYLLAYLALCTELSRSAHSALLLGLSHVLARVLGGAASALLPSAGEGLQSTFRSAASRCSGLTFALWLLACLAAALALRPAAVPAAAIICAACFFRLRHIARREFGGMSGDLAGYLITSSALWLLAGLVITEKVVLLCF